MRSEDADRRIRAPRGPRLWRVWRFPGAACRVLLVLLAGLAALALGPGAAGAAPLSVLTYNVAGLPLGLSGSNPSVNNALISPLLNPYDLVAVQEDFGFHDDLTSQLTHPYRSVKDAGFGSGIDQITDDPAAFLDPARLGDGLNRFSRSPFQGHARITWDDCFGVLSNGSDCLAPKGFSFARHELMPGAFLDVYNLHADAGGEAEDLSARRANLRQLADFITGASSGRAVLVLGDTNSRYTRAGDILPELLATASLADVWVELARGGAPPAAGAPSLQDCATDPASGGCEVVDKIFFRSGGGVTLTPTGYVVPPEFVDANGDPLSDHLPIGAVFDVAFVPEPGAGGLGLLGLAAVGVFRRRRPSGLGSGRRGGNVRHSRSWTCARSRSTASA